MYIGLVDAQLPELGRLSRGEGALRVTRLPTAQKCTLSNHDFTVDLFVIDHWLGVQRSHTSPTVLS
jgi:hypothetical protein